MAEQDRITQEVSPNHVILEWDTKGALKMTVAGILTYEHLIVGAFLLERTAGKMMAAVEAEARPVKEPPRLDVVQSIPDSMRQ